MYQINTWGHLRSDSKPFGLIMNSLFAGSFSFINILIRLPSWIYLGFFFFYQVAYIWVLTVLLSKLTYQGEHNSIIVYKWN